MKVYKNIHTNSLISENDYWLLTDNEKQQMIEFKLEDKDFWKFEEDKLKTIEEKIIFYNKIKLWKI